MRRYWHNKSESTVAEESRWSAEDAMAEPKRLRKEVANLRRADEILMMTSPFAVRFNTTRH